MKKFFTIAVQGNNDSIYEDNTCLAKVIAANFRDECWYIGMGEVINKKAQEKCKLTLSQKRVLFQRISNELHQELYSDELNTIIFEKDEASDMKFVNLLEVNE